MQLSLLPGEFCSGEDWWCSGKGPQGSYLNLSSNILLKFLFSNQCKHLGETRPVLSKLSLFYSPAFLCEEDLHCILQLFKSYLNPALFFNAFFLLFRRRGIDLVARHHLRRNHSFITNQTKKTVQAQCTDHNLCEGTKQTCPGLCARVYLGLLLVSELRQCLSLLNTGLDRGKSKNKLTCRGAITWTSEGRAACLWAIIPHLLLVLFLFQGNG